MCDDILEFQGEYRWLSNFWPVIIQYEGYKFPSNEHFYQAMKFKETRWDFFTKCRNPKKEARKIPYNYTHNLWNKYKVGIMWAGLHIKFQDYILKDKLLNTGNVEIVEGNSWHDNFWGNCLCDKCKNIDGENILGKYLMLIREEIKNG